MANCNIFVSLSIFISSSHKIIQMCALLCVWILQIFLFCALMLDCFSIFFFLLRNFLLITHVVTESAIDGMRENITPLVLRCTPCGNMQV